MKVLVAGATGAIGRSLLPVLNAAGHEVVGTTRSERKAELLRARGAEAVVLDATDLEALRGAVLAAAPEVVVNQLTALPDTLDYRDPETFAATNRLRAESGPALAAAAVEAGARRLISQSVAFFYEPEGAAIKGEDAPLIELPAETPLGSAVAALRTLERATLQTEGVEGIVLRYGYFYGPATHYAADGGTAAEVRKRRFPVVGAGTGVFSFIHVDDAASATLAALERGVPGVYNVADDEPAELREWLPAYAEAIGAKRPFRVPAWIARLIAGREVAEMATVLRGAANAKAKRELGWEPRYRSWRQGFREALG